MLDWTSNEYYQKNSFELVIDRYKEQDINEFNSKIEQISHRNAQQSSKLRSPEERFFSEIEGYNDRCYIYQQKLVYREL